MSHAHPIDRKRALFPSNWVIGTAAADLARNDPGVLLPGDPIPDDQRDGETVPAPSTNSNPHSRADEIAALHAENERLRQRMMATRQRLRPLAARAAMRPQTTPSSTTAQAMPAHELRAAPRARAHGRRGISRVASVALLLLISVVVAAAWYSLQDSDKRSQALHQARVLGSDWRAGAAELGAVIVSRSDALIARVDSMTTRVSGLWTHAAERRASDPDEALPAAGAGGQKNEPSPASRD